MGPVLFLVLTSSVALAIILAMIVVALLLPRHSKRLAAAAASARHPSVRLLSRLLFARRQPDAITLDCLLVSVEDPAPGVVAPPGLPFTLQLLAPEPRMAQQVDDLLNAWAADSRELLFELRQEQGRVRTTIASGDSSVQLVLSGAAGLQLNP
ncbi:MAG: hypothetical protein KY454_13875 [Actinobacteria bacterium]|nr:hypothetical protein [Actinomycetota bacterium]